MIDDARPGRARQVVDDFLEGFNGTIFAYGQTGSSSSAAAARALA